MTQRDRLHPGLRAIFICQAVDRDDPVLAGTIAWIESLARQPMVDRVTVLSLRTGNHELAGGLRPERFGRSSRVSTLTAFYRALARSLRPRPDFFFVYQGGPYPLVLLPLRLGLRVPVVQWCAHPVISRMTAFQARFCEDLILTSARSAFPMELPKVRVVGQGIDTDQFRPASAARDRDFIAACRIAPRKRIDQMIKAVAAANRRFDARYTLDVYGPTLPGNEAYAAELVDLIAQLGAGEWITLNGPVPQQRLPSLFNSHRATLNFSATAIDRSVVEAMACGLPVLSTNDSVAEMVPDDLRPILITDKDDTETQASAIRDLLTMQSDEEARLRHRMRELMVNEHSIDLLMGRIMREMQELLHDRR